LCSGKPFLIRRVITSSKICIHHLYTSFVNHFFVQHEYNKQDFKAIRGKLTGTAILIAKGIRGRHAHYWEMSQDGTNWIPLMPTLAAKTTVNDLTKGSIWNFRHCYILKDGPTDWLYSEDLVIA
jgi:hypothetical protein